MHRLAVLVASCAVCYCSWAAAAPFDQLSNQLQDYDQGHRGYQTPGVRQTRTSYQNAPPAATSAPAPSRTMYQPMPEESLWDEGGYGYGGCDDGFCDDCNGCLTQGFWGRAEYLYWWVRGSKTPPLLTTSPSGTSASDAGVLPNATTLFGNETLNDNGRSGGRFTLGYWLPGCNQMSIENTFFFLGDSDDSFTMSSGGTPILARPFFNTVTGEQDSVLLAFPQINTGSFAVSSSNRVYGNDINVRRALYADCFRRLDILVGYRYFQMNEGLNITTSTTSLSGQTAPQGTTFDVQDNFGTRSLFNGAQMGLNGQWTQGCWTFDLLGKIAIGGIAQRATINGSTVVTVPGETPVTNEGGILALGSNSGTHTRNRFAVIPEFAANLRYQVTDLWTVSFGYTLMVVTNVVRPGDQISTQLNPNQFPPGEPGAFPQFTFKDSDLWLQGLNVGLECNF